MHAADLTIYPQSQTFVPGAHLDIREAQHVQKDWFDFAVNDPEHVDGTWTIVIATTRGTNIVTIPRSAKMPAPAMAVAA